MFDRLKRKVKKKELETIKKVVTKRRPPVTFKLVTQITVPVAKLLEDGELTGGGTSVETYELCELTFDELLEIMTSVSGELSNKIKESLKVVFS